MKLRRSLVLMVLTTALSCVGTGHRGPSGLDSASVRAESALRANRLDEAIEIYEERLVEDRTDLAAYRGLARSYALRGYQGQQGEEDYRSSRETGLRCLLRDPGFRAQVDAAGGIVTGEALLRVDEDEWPCLYWAAWSWARWVMERGAGVMAMDHDVLREMSLRVSLLAGEGEAGAHALRGMALALSSDGYSSASEEFERAIELDPGSLPIRVDYARWVLWPSGREAAARSQLSEVLASEGVPNASPLVVANNEKAAALAVQLLADWEHSTREPEASGF